MNALAGSQHLIRLFLSLPKWMCVWEIPASGLGIFELPDGRVRFSVGNNLNITSVEIIDMLGRTLYQLKGMNPTEVYELSNLSQAAYMAKVTLSNGQVITKKAVKQR